MSPHEATLTIRRARQIGECQERPYRESSRVRQDGERAPTAVFHVPRSRLLAGDARPQHQGRIDTESHAATHVVVPCRGPIRPPSRHTAKLLEHRERLRPPREDPPLHGARPEIVKRETNKVPKEVTGNDAVFQLRSNELPIESVCAFPIPRDHLRRAECLLRAFVVDVVLDDTSAIYPTLENLHRRCRSEDAGRPEAPPRTLPSTTT